MKLYANFCGFCSFTYSVECSCGGVYSDDLCTLLSECNGVRADSAAKVQNSLGLHRAEEF